MIIFGLVTLNKSNSDLRHGHYTKYSALVCLETDYFFSTSSRKNNQFQDFTRADYLVQRPAFGHYLIINLLHAGIIKVSITHKKLGITKDIAATKVLPFLFPLCIDNNLNLNQVRFVFIYILNNQ